MCIFIEFYNRTIFKNLCNIKMYRTVASFNVTPCTSLLLPVLRSFLVTLYIAHLWKNISFLTALNMTRPSVTLIVGSNARTYIQILLNQTYSFYDKISNRYNDIHWNCFIGLPCIPYQPSIFQRSSPLLFRKSTPNSFHQLCRGINCPSTVAYHPQIVLHANEVSLNPSV